MNGVERQRIDKWLFFARAVKSRSLAAKLVQAGHVRLNREKIDQAAQLVKTGDVLTMKLERRVVVWRVLLPGKRRGPAEEARTL
jgi:ribosome-associated heat shock protein Hsp15